MSAAGRELARLVHYVFSTLGRRRIGEDDWVRVLALERKWVPPSKARRLAAAARSLGLLRNAGERDYEMGLEAEGLTLPVDYRPDFDAVEASPEAVAASVEAAKLPLFRRVVRHVAERLGQGEAEVVGRVNATQAALGGLLTAEVAAIYDAALQGVDVAPFLDEAEALLG